MDKKFALTLAILVIIAAGSLLLSYTGMYDLGSRLIPGAGKEKPTVILPNIRNTTYTIDGVPVTLTGGISEEKITNSNSVKTTMLTEFMKYNNLDNNKTVDAAVILTQQTGGTGTFYYIAGALRTDEVTTGTNALLLGDRIKVKSLDIKDGVIEVVTLTRKPKEAFTVAPSIEQTMRLKVLNGILVDAQSK